MSEFDYSEWSVSDEDRISEFEEKTHRDFDSIKNWIPPKVESMLDIGCGRAAIDILFSRSYPEAEIHLMDGDGTGKELVGFVPELKAWDDVRMAKRFVTTNVSSPDKIFVHIADPLLTIPSDLIISLKSWGHHYPVDIYIDLVRRSLRGGGRVVMDIRRERKNQEHGLAKMTKAGFRLVARGVYETPKCERMVFGREGDF
jgi:SAM-dependent methyltransferase